MSTGRAEFLVLNSPWSVSPGIIRLRATDGLSADEASPRRLNGGLQQT